MYPPICVGVLCPVSQTHCHVRSRSQRLLSILPCPPPLHNKQNNVHQIRDNKLQLEDEVIIICHILIQTIIILSSNSKFMFHPEYILEHFSKIVTDDKVISQ